MAENIFNEFNQELENEVNNDFAKLNEVGKVFYLNKRKKYLLKTCLISSISTILLSILFIVLALLYKENFYVLLTFFVVSLLFSAISIIYYFVAKNQPQDKLIKDEIKKRIIPQFVKRNSHKITNKKMVTPGFEVTKTIRLSTGGWANQFLMFDDEHEKIIFKKGNNFSKDIKYSAILNYEIYENGNSVVQGTAGKALIGGLFFGLGGMIVGGSLGKEIKENCNNLKIIIRINDINTPQLVISYIKNLNISKNSFTYKTMKENLQEVCSTLEYVLNKKSFEDSTEKREIKPLSKKEELTELKELLNESLITQEEYEKKKKQILGV